MTSYGLPYQGSKNKIAKRVIDCLPQAEYFVDLFAGGCAMTHAAIESEKYNKFIVNDLSQVPQIFVDALHGEYEKWSHVPTKEEFYALKDVDEAVALLFSFGNQKRTYLWGEEIAKVKTICSNMIVAPSIKERYAYFKAFIKYMLENNAIPKDSNRHFCQLQAVNVIERLQNIAQTPPHSCDITVLQTSYADVDIPENAVVYADPPYRGTAQDAYGPRGANMFDFETFDKWLNTVDFLVYVSEYTAPPNMVEIAHFDIRKTLGPNKEVTERLFVQERFFDTHERLMGKLDLGL